MTVPLEVFLNKLAQTFAGAQVARWRLVIGEYELLFIEIRDPSLTVPENYFLGQLLLVVRERKCYGWIFWPTAKPDRVSSVRDIETYRLRNSYRVWLRQGRVDL